MGAFVSVDEQRLLGAFPADLDSTVRAVVATLSPPIHRLEQSFTVLVREDIVVIPYRLYYAEPVPGSGPLLVGDQALVRACLMSRNHDGHVRQRAVERLLASSEDWVVPFVVQLVGEYVVEIMETIWADLASDLTGLHSPRRDAYQRFVRANPDFIVLTRARVTSYWACYYRNRFPDWDKQPNRADYPGYRLIEYLSALA